MIFYKHNKFKNETHTHIHTGKDLKDNFTHKCIYNILSNLIDTIQ